MSLCLYHYVTTCYSWSEFHRAEEVASLVEVEFDRAVVDENQLIVRCQTGDRDAFEELFYLYREDVFRFSYLVVRDAVLAQDVVQEAFLKVFRSSDKFQFRSSFKSWLYRIVVNEAITILRRRKLKEDLDPAPDAGKGQDARNRARDSQPEEAALQSEERDMVHWAIGQLDPIHRSVVVLKYYHDFSDSEIATVVGCPLGTVKSRLHRARELLRHELSRVRTRPIGDANLLRLAYRNLEEIFL